MITTFLEDFHKPDQPELNMYKFGQAWTQERREAATERPQMILQTGARR
jgi:hypothetical protein